MPLCLRYVGRAVSLFFRLFVLRTAKVMFLPGTPPKGSPIEPPLVIRKLQRRPYLATTTFLAMILLLPPISHGLGIDPASYPYLTFVLVLVFLAGGFAVLRWVATEVRAITREAHDNGCCLCLRCGYCLKGLPEKHQCPECGTAYDITEVKQKWSAYLADRAARETPW
jgi:hypothetical protein